MTPSKNQPEPILPRTNSAAGGFEPAHQLWTNRQCFQETCWRGFSHLISQNWWKENECVDEKIKIRFKQIMIFHGGNCHFEVREAKIKLEKQKAETIVKLQEVFLSSAKSSSFEKRIFIKKSFLSFKTRKGYLWNQPLHFITNIKFTLITKTIVKIIKINY